MFDAYDDNVKYISSGHFCSEDSWIHPKRRIDSNEIISVIKGTVYIAENDKEYILNPGDVLLLESGLEHHGTHYSNNVEFFWIHYTPVKTSLPVKHFLPIEPFEINSQIKHILHMSNTPNYPETSLDAAMILLLNEILFQYVCPSAYKGNELLSKIFEYIRINAGKHISVAEVAEYFGYTTGYISKAFKKTYKVSMKQYIAEEQIKHAKDLLMTTTLPVKEIALKMGYDDENTFVKFFVYHTKKGPSKFRNINFNTHINNK